MDPSMEEILEELLTELLSILLDPVSLRLIISDQRGSMSLLIFY